MQILDTLLSLLTSPDAKEKIAPILDAISKNNFNLAEVLKNIDITAVLPLVQSLFSQKQQTPPPVNANPLSPVSDIADREIVFALNRYISSV